MTRKGKDRLLPGRISMGECQRRADRFNEEQGRVHYYNPFGFGANVCAAVTVFVVLSALLWPLIGLVALLEKLT